MQDCNKILNKKCKKKFTLESSYISIIYLVKSLTYLGFVE